MFNLVTDNVKEDPLGNLRDLGVQMIMAMVSVTHILWAIICLPKCADLAQ